MQTLQSHKYTWLCIRALQADIQDGKDSSGNSKGMGNALQNFERCCCTILSSLSYYYSCFYARGLCACCGPSNLFSARRPLPKWSLKTITVGSNRGPSATTEDFNHWTSIRSYCPNIWYIRASVSIASCREGLC